MQVITNMCGIFYNNFSLNSHQTNKILSLLKNRGPDKSNFIKIKNQNFIFTWLSTMNFWWLSHSANTYKIKNFFQW